MSSENDIAIVGMALRVPGAHSISDFWRNLSEGRESLHVFSAEELRAEGVSPALLENSAYVRAGMTLAGYDEFDAGFFGFSPMEAAVLDPQHRQFYEVAWEALENAGCVPERFEGAIGVFAGCGAGTYFHQQPAAQSRPDAHRSATSCCATPATTRTSSRRACRTPSTCAVPASTCRRPAPPRWWRRTWPCRACSRANATWRWPVA